MDDEGYILNGVTSELFDGSYPPIDDNPSMIRSRPSTQVITYPLSGPAEYRGWYHIASGPNSGNSRWCPRQSKFGGPRRGGTTHRGADLYSHGRERLMAITDGNIEYRTPQPAGWGNHIYLYFRVGGLSYIAIYAHIDSSSAFAGIRSVAGGDTIGTAGCSGNAGNDGQCWRSFTCDGRIAAEDHLHLELLEFGTNPLRRLDPIAFFGWTVAFASDLTCEPCAVTDQLI